MHFKLPLVLILFCTSVAAGVYRWQDENGNIHYSDRPIVGAEELSISGIKSGRVDTDLASDDAGTAAQASPLTEQPTDGYVEFILVEPEQNKTVRNDAGDIPVGVLVQPALREGHEILIVLDGISLEKRVISPQFTLSGLSRGTHTLQARITDAGGETIASTEVVNFHVRKAPIYPEGQ